MRLATASQVIGAGDTKGGGDGSGDGGGGGGESTTSGDAGGAGDGTAGGTFGQMVLDGAVHLSPFVMHGLNSPGLRGSLV